MARRHQTNEEWIAEALADSERQKPATGIACFHVSAVGAAREVDAIDLGRKTWDPASIARRINGKVASYSESLEGIQAFELRVYYGSDEAVAVHPFTTIEGEISTGNGEHARERATANGQLAQLMRHLENRERNLLAKEQQFLSFMQAVIVPQMQNQAALQREVFDAYTIIREMIMQQGRDMHEQRQRDLDAAQSRTERERLFGYLPGLVNTLTGKEIMPNTSVDSSIVETMAQTVKPEMVDTLVAMGIVPAEASIIVKNRLEQIRAKKQAEAEAVAKVPPTSTELVTLNGQTSEPT